MTLDDDDDDVVSRHPVFNNFHPKPQPGLIFTKRPVRYAKCNGDVCPPEVKLKWRASKECVSYLRAVFSAYKAPARYLSGAHRRYHPEPRVQRGVVGIFTSAPAIRMPRDISARASCEPPGERGDFLRDPVGRSGVRIACINPSGTCLPHVARQFAMFRDVK